jgi:aldose 1-epimerase
MELQSETLRVRLMPFGARLVSVIMDGVDLVQGGGTVEQLQAGDWTAGAVCGRHAGRITNAAFVLDGFEHKLVPNMGVHQLHGGANNFGNQDWRFEQQGNAVKFLFSSPDGDQGFPGAVEASATYELKGSVLSLDLEAATTKPTVINLTNHAYWNLAGGGNAFGHEMQINGDHYLPLNELLLPSGEIAAVAGTRWDFCKLRRIGEPYDNCWQLTGKRGTLRQGLVLRDPKSRRRMEVWTTDAGMQMYTAIHWNEGMPGKHGPLKQHTAIAIEPQNFPDAINHENFPSAVLRPGEVYRHRMEWRFSHS